MMTHFLSEKEKGSSRDVFNIQSLVHVIMSNQTLTAYAGNELSERKIWFNIKFTVFQRSEKHENCFLLVEGKIKAEFCAFGYSSKALFYEQWDYEYNLFKYQCLTKREIARANITNHLAGELQQEAKVSYTSSILCSIIELFNT